MPNGQQPFAPWLQPAPWEQTLLGRLFAPKVSVAEQQRLQQQVTPYATGVLQEAGLPARITPEQWGGMQREQPPMPTPPPSPPPEAEQPSWIGEPARVPAEKAPEGYDWVWDSSTMRYVMKPRAGVAPMPTELSPWQKAQQERWEAEAAQVPQITPWQQEQMDWQQQQAMQAQAQQQAQMAWQEQQAMQAGQQWQQQFKRS